MTQINVYLHFDGKCREAMTFYRECLGGELTMMTAGESPMAANIPAAMKDKIMHARLQSGGLVLMGSDMMGPWERVAGNTISVIIMGGGPEELRSFFSKLSKGGKVTHELEEVFFGTYGDLTDKFGVDWMFQADAKRA